jgi:hypothetical protein
MKVEVFTTGWGVPVISQTRKSDLLVPGPVSVDLHEAALICPWNDRQMTLALLLPWIKKNRTPNHALKKSNVTFSIIHEMIKSSIFSFFFVAAYKLQGGVKLTRHVLGEPTCRNHVPQLYPVLISDFPKKRKPCIHDGFLIPCLPL